MPLATLMTVEVQQIQLSNTSFEGNNNAYLLKTEEKTILIDTGDGTPETLNQLQNGILEYNTDISDIDHIFLTHWHDDHAGLAGEIQARSGASVHAHEKDLPLVEQRSETWKNMYETRMEYYDQWGMPEHKQQDLESFFRQTDLTMRSPDVTPIQDGDTFTFGSTTLRVVHIPGHTAGLCLFEVNNGTDIAFTGDALLPMYTPNVGGADLRVVQPLKQYLDGLGQIIDTNYTRAWPGHRSPIDNPVTRATEIIDHHKDRTIRIINMLVNEGPCDAWTVSNHLFGKLENIHILHGPGEAYAHLDHLEQTGAVHYESGTYQLSSRVKSLLESDKQNKIIDMYF